MTEENDSMRLKRNPELFRQVTYGLADEISARFRKREMSPRVKLLCEEVLVSKLQEIVKIHTDNIWCSYDIEENATDLVALVDATTSEKPAWRPKTGDVDTDAKQAIRLKYQNSLLKKMINKNTIYIKDLEAAIKHQRNEEDKQMARIVKAINDNL